MMLGGVGIPNPEREQQRWKELYPKHERAHDGVFTALQFVRFSRGTLRRLREEAGEERPRVDAGGACLPAVGRAPCRAPSCAAASLLRAPPDALQRAFTIPKRPNLPPCYNIAPTQKVPIGRGRRGGEGGRELALCGGAW
jgi:hypothetical protein